jgi:acetolactate synthase-1/2/3 large subunit
MVNYGQNSPEMLLCPHEEIAVQMAHGYAKASGKPMLAIVHNVVGLLNSCLAVYYAYIDRAPIFIAGATGPLAEAQRRPKIDWIHSANVQGEAVRNYTKWDAQPATVDGVPELFARGYGIMMSEPQGPIYMCYDAGLQEEELKHDVPLPPPAAARVPTPIAADPTALAEAAGMLAAAKHPVIIAEYAGRNPQSFHDLVKLAETVSAPVYDVNSRLNFPGRHPLNMSMIQDVFRDADLVVCLDVRDWERATTTLDKVTRITKSIVPEKCKWIDIGFSDLEISGWALEYQRLLNADLRILADTTTAIPALTKLCRARLAKKPSLKTRNAARGRRIEKMHVAARAKWEKEAKRNWNQTPMTLPRLASEVWDVIKDEDWVLTANTLQDWALKLWDFDTPYRHPGKSLGTSTQIGISLGVALAHKGLGRLVVDIQPDGDLMFNLGSLWVASKYKIPMLVVMYNNRAYYNDWEHQLRMARLRGTPEDRAHIGMDLYGPEPDFAGVARSLGWHAEGPIENGDDVAAALRRAIVEVKAGRPALVDTITQKR